MQTVAEQGARELIHAQEHHYKKVVLRESDIDKLESHFKRALDGGKDIEISLPDNYNPRQLGLWPDQILVDAPKYVE